MKYILLPLLALWLVSPAAKANVCGTDYQNFNPTTNGLDFVTVQSSETLSPCIINLGMFLNYAANSLTYSRTLNNGFPAGQKRKDRSLGADFSVGMGLTERWDFGLSIPVLLNQTVSSDHYVASFDDPGIMEIKINTKYRLLGDHNGGLAAVVSMNKNLVEDNPFAGSNAGPTWNFELAADTTLATKWALAVNGGYRLRDPGEQIAGVPFVPLQDQWIYSVAGSYLFSSIDTKLILELYGSRAVKKTFLDSDRNLNSLEALAGIKHDLSRNMAMHMGATHAIDSSQGGADWRVYAGLNWALGPVCKTKTSAPVTPTVSESANEPAKLEEFSLDVELLFGWDSDKIEPAAFETLDPFFKEILERKFERIVVEGHTDSIGNEFYNLDLSQRRAHFVRQQLISRYKIPADKVEAAGFGQTQPIADNGNYQGRRKNRRVSVKVWR